MTKTERRDGFTDRRKRSPKDYHKNNRLEIRREEDRKNLVGYYITVIFSFSLLIALGIASFFYQNYQ